MPVVGAARPCRVSRVQEPPARATHGVCHGSPVPPEQLVDGIRTVVAGDALVAPAVPRRLLAAYAGRRPPDREQLRLAARLTEREADVLRALADGLSNAEIARRVWLSPETVKTHVTSILGKLGVRDRTQAVVWATGPGSSAR